MGKRVKSKGRNPRKLQHRAVSGDREADAGSEGSKVVENCNHFTKGSAALNRILSEIGSSSKDARCDDCRVEPTKKRGGKDSNNARQPKKKGGSRSTESEGVSGLQLMWVCLDCSRCYCGGAVSDEVPYGHARRHAKGDHHSWAVRFDDPSVCWCYPCNSVVPVEVLEELKGDKKSAMDIENVDSGTSVGRGVGIENVGVPLVLESTKGYAVRGLVNLGNTCFFNSVMQNLLALDTLRDYLASLDHPAGPLTMALKKLFVESSSRDSKGALNPKALFGCVCVKAPQFKGFQQQDSHELLRYLLEGLHTEEAITSKSLDSSVEQEKGALNTEPTFVDVIFGGQLSSTVSCVECGHMSIVQEPFLDLSLPVPSKKLSPKKVSVSWPKKNKMPSREGNRGWKVQGKRIAKGSPLIGLHNADSSSSPSECNDSCVPAPEPTQTTVLAVEEDFSWMDYIGSAEVLDDTDSVSQKCEVPIAQHSESGQICDGENYVQRDPDLQDDTGPKEEITASDSSRTISCRDESPSSCTEDPAVVSLPHKELDSTGEDINRLAQNPESVAFVGSVVKESSEQTASAGCPDLAEFDFDGLGDLFNEPEVTSDLNIVAGTGKGTDTTLLAGNSSESNQDEVDNTSSVVSVDSCLALFTKSELLPDDHSWNCDRCSAIQSAECRKVKRQAIAKLDQLEALKSQVDGGEVRREKPSPNLEVDLVESIELKVLGSEEMIANSKDLVPHTGGLYDKNADVGNPHAPWQNIIGAPSNTALNDRQRGDERSSELLNLASMDEAFCPDVLLKDGAFAELDHSFLNLTCPPAYQASVLQETYGKQDSNFCSINGLNKAACGGQDLAAVSSSSPDCIETIQDSCENDNFSEVNQVGIEGSRLLVKVHPVNDSEGEKMETEIRRVKRDATKRFLINRAPSILTIHLKRFSQDHRGRLNKLRGHVSFQELLDLRPYMDSRSGGKGKCCYQLVGLVEHSGNMTGGHYVAYLKGSRSRDKPTWFYVSDANVREAPFSEVLRSEAYILFYEKVC